MSKFRSAIIFVLLVLAIIFVIKHSVTPKGIPASSQIETRLD